MMQKIRGQERLLNEIDSYNIDTFPTTSLIVGEPGSGKNLVVEYIASKLHLNKVNITDLIGNEIYHLIEPTLVYVDIDNTSISDQNRLLKVVEEPPTGVFIVLMVSDKDNLIETLLSRCHEFKLDRYDAEFLRNFVVGDDHSFSLEIGTTPGDIIRLNSIDLEKLTSICYEVLDGIGLLRAIELVEEIEKYDVDIFLKAMLAVEFKDSGRRDPDTMTKYMRITADTLKISKNKTIDRSKILSSYLTAIIGANKLER